MYRSLYGQDPIRAGSKEQTRGTDVPEDYSSGRLTRQEEEA